MQHPSFCSENRISAQESPRRWQSILKFLAMMLVAGFLLVPKDAFAYSATLQNLRDAIAGNAAARNLIATEIGIPNNVTQRNAYFNAVITRLGGATNALNRIDQALAGNMASLSYLHTQLGGAALPNITYGCGKFSCTYPWMNAARDVTNFMIAGNGDVAINSLILLLQSPAGSTNNVFNRMTGGYGYIVYQTVVAVMSYGGVHTNPADVTEAIDNLNLFKSGDPLAIEAFEDIVIGFTNPTHPGPDGIFGNADDVTIVPTLMRDWIAQILSYTPSAPPPTPPSPYDGLTEKEMEKLIKDNLPGTIMTPEEAEKLIKGLFPDLTPKEVTDLVGTLPVSVPPVGAAVDVKTAKLEEFAKGKGPSTSAPCSASSAPYTSKFNPNPCRWARDNSAIIWSKNAFGDAVDSKQGGWQVGKNLADLWNNTMLEDLKNMTAQLHAAIIDQTRQMGSMMDSHGMTKAITGVQDMELEAKRRLMPNENSCVAASATPALATTTSVANALSASMTNEQTVRGAGTAGTPSERGPGADNKARFSTFCSMFLDPTMNNGQNACPSPTVAGAIPDGDINVEKFLLKDTINLHQPEEMAAAQALLANLVLPRVFDPLPESVVDSPAGQEAILKREHLKAIRSIPTDVVSSIISRRAAIPLQDPSTNIVREIREKAGIAPAQISDQPSYNEIMLAMTKERFMNPAYFAKMGGNTGAIKQEQTNINAYISLQMQDIYKLQEQINALMAARASLKLDEYGGFGSQSGSVPQR